LATAAAAPAAVKAEVVNLGLVGVGSDVRVETLNQFLGGGLGGLYYGAVQFKLDALTIVGADIREDEGPWTNKVDLVIPPIPPLPPVYAGKTPKISANQFPPPYMYEATAEAGIATTPIVGGVPVGSQSIGFLAGVQSDIDLLVKLDPRDVGPASPWIALLARATVEDPFHFTGFADDDRLVLDISLRAGDGFYLRGSEMNMATVLTASTSIPGMETLLRLQISGAGTADGQETLFSIAFDGLDALAIDEQAVISSILQAIIWNPDEMRYVFAHDVTLFEGFVDIPDEFDDFDLAVTHTSWVSRGVSVDPPEATVPEPPMHALLGAAIVALALTSARRGDGLKARTPKVR
jgi:hypothetical protein